MTLPPAVLEVRRAAYEAAPRVFSASLRFMLLRKWSRLPTNESIKRNAPSVSVGSLSLQVALKTFTWFPKINGLSVMWLSH